MRTDRDRQLDRQETDNAKQMRCMQLQEQRDRGSPRGAEKSSRNSRMSTDGHAQVAVKTLYIIHIEA